MNMAAAVLALAAAVVAASAADAGGLEARAKAVIADDSLSPVSKVVTLLTDMRKEMEADAEADADINEEMVCWCKTNDKKHTALIAENTEKSASLRAEIESLRGKAEDLNTEIGALNKELSEGREKLAEAIGIRKEDLVKFTATEQSTMESIKQLDGAIVALGPVRGSSMQVELDSESPVAKALRASMQGHHKAMLWAIHTKRERKILEDLISHDRDVDFMQDSSRGKVSAPSDVVTGAIRSLSDTFKDNLKQLQSDEAKDSAAHEGMKKAKTQQIEAQVVMLDKKTESLADTDERAANARNELDDAVTAVAEDSEYLKNLKVQCAMHSKEYDARTTTRQEEMEAISKALLLLTADDAKDTFTRTLGHQKRGEKLGSRTLKEYKEERHTSSMRSETNAARKTMWGAEGAVFFLQTAAEPVHTQAALLNSALRKGSVDGYDIDPHLSAAAKLAAIADRTQQVWKAKYYMEASDVKAKQAEEAKAAKERKEHPVKQSKAPPKLERNAVGLTAAEVKMHAAGMKDVGAGIRKMRENLELQQGEEGARRDWCQDSIHTTERKLDQEKRNKADEQEKVELMEQQIGTLHAQIRGLSMSQSNADVELAKAGIDRKKSSKNFQKTVGDQQLTKKLLSTTLGILEAFYKKKKAALINRKGFRGNPDLQSNTVSGLRAAAGSVLGESPWSLSEATKLAAEEVRAGGEAGLEARGDELGVQPVSFVQLAAEPSRKKQSLDESLAVWDKKVAVLPKAMLQDDDPNGRRPPPPAGFSKGGYKKGAASGGLLVMIQGLISDAEAMIKECVADETDAMKGYEAYVAGANELTTQRQEAITNRRVEIGKLEGFVEESKIRLNETIKEVARLRQYDIDLYGVEGCDYLLKNYETRYIERKEEIDSLKEAEAILGAEQSAAAKTEEEAKKPAEEVPTDMTAVDGGVKEVHGDEKAILHMGAGPHA